MPLSLLAMRHKPTWSQDFFLVLCIISYKHFLFMYVAENCFWEWDRIHVVIFLVYCCVLLKVVETEPKMFQYFKIDIKIVALPFHKKHWTSLPLFWPALELPDPSMSFSPSRLLEIPKLLNNEFIIASLCFEGELNNYFKANWSFLKI